MRLSVGSAQAKGLGQRSAPPLARAAAPVEWPCQERPRARESTGRHGRTLKHWGDRRALVLTASSTNQDFQRESPKSHSRKARAPSRGELPQQSLDTDHLLASDPSSRTMEFLYGHLWTRHLKNDCVPALHETLSSHSMGAPPFLPHGRKTGMILSRIHCTY